MSIAPDGNAFSSTTSTSLTYSQAFSGANRIVFINVLTAAPSVALISDVTVGGSSAVQVIDSVSYVDGSQTWFNTLWYKVAPATGSQSIVVSVLGTAFIFSASSSYTGAAQVSPIDSYGTGADISKTVDTFGVTATVAGGTPCWGISTPENHTAVETATSGVFRSAAGNGSGIFDTNGNIGAVSGLMRATTSGVNVPWSSVWASFKEAASPNFTGYIAPFRWR